jgi:hypothetical protein
MVSFLLFTARTNIALVACILFFLATTGCGSRPYREDLPAYHQVRGSVTCDGQPLAEGRVIFEGEDDARLAISPSYGEIKAGQYQMRAYAGPKKVRISVLQEYGDRDDLGARPVRETIAAEYNDASTLRVDVSSDGPNVFDFSVTSRRTASR